MKLSENVDELCQISQGRAAFSGSQQPFNKESLHGHGTPKRLGFESPPTYHLCDFGQVTNLFLSLRIPSVNWHENIYLIGLLLRESMEAVFISSADLRASYIDNGE